MTKPTCERIEPLGEQHDRSGFSCGVDALDRYFRTQAGQDSRRRIAACFVLTAADGTVAGYYTLSATNILLTELPSATAKKLPRYPLMPATLMGRLAVAKKYQGQKFGELLLLDAFARTLRSEIASFAFVVDAKDAAAVTFYERLGFIRLPSTERRLFKPVSEIATLFA
ncbi:MAG TPA: GNAT family N-acetyltransferase [Rhizomicrobium sp.]